jgi:hypothetical protein
VLAEWLAKVVESLPEIVGDDEQPLPVNAATLRGFAPQNLRALQEAIRADINPNASPSVSSPVS